MIALFGIATLCFSTLCFSTHCLTLTSAELGVPGPAYVDTKRGIAKQRAAADAAADVVRSGEVARVIELLADDSALVRDRVVRDVIANWDETQVAALSAALRSSSPLAIEGVAEILGKRSVGSSAKALSRLLSKRPLGAAHSTIVNSLGALGHGDAWKPLASFFKKKKKDGYLRATALRSLVAIDEERAETMLTAALSDTLPEVRAAAIDILATRDRAPWLLQVPAWVSDSEFDTHPSGPIPLFTTLDLLRSFSGRADHRDALVIVIDALLARVESATGRARSDLFRTLRSVTGQRIADDPDLWKSYWATQRESWKPADDAAAAPGDKVGGTAVVKIHGIPVDSTRVLFLQDLSGGMSRNADNEYDGAGPTRLDFAKRELKTVLGQLDNGCYAHLVSFASFFGSSESARQKLKKSRRSLLAFADGLEVPKKAHHNRGNLYDSLVWCLGRSHVDTIYLLTEGAPTEGKYLDFDRFLEHFEREWRDRRVRVHVVYLGSPKGRNRSFMEKIARMTGGDFHTVNVFGEKD